MSDGPRAFEPRRGGRAGVPRALSSRLRVGQSPDGSRAHRGHAAVAEFLRVLWPAFRERHALRPQPARRVRPADRARGRSSFEAVGDIDGEAFVAAGYYENECVRTADGWKLLLHREVPLFFVEEKEGWAGPKPAIMSRWLKKPRL